ncbi:transcription termination/antitermination NusG family protein [Candidatus Stoquefichus massiliensis]|uniref:transcription termination/antitermination NusG family protein n=1 Tax=Candidatus Stoquefichus massiliensis TaxID=1470350 RepID=UPI000485F646|nr:transcription termination/antitermination NusG family protein [Candidatus Stoquefichus massiliensis]
MNWYVLYTLSQKTNKILNNLNQKKGLEAFVPQYEVCSRDTKELLLRTMFDNYIFVKTSLDQVEFSTLLMKMKDINDGLIKQLKNNETSALRADEIEFFNQILDHDYIARISHGYRVNGKTVVTDGPLVSYENHIVKVDTHNCCAYLDLTFFDRKIKVGIDIKSKK